MLFILRFAELQSAEELERLTVDEKLQPVERAVYLLRSVTFVLTYYNKQSSTEVELTTKSDPGYESRFDNVVLIQSARVSHKTTESLRIGIAS